MGFMGPISFYGKMPEMGTGIEEVWVNAVRINPWKGQKEEGTGLGEKLDCNQIHGEF